MTLACINVNRTPYVPLVSLANGLVLVGVNQRADAFVAENLREKTLLDPAINDVDARDTSAGSSDTVLQLRQQRRRQFAALTFEDLLGLVDRQMALQFQSRLGARAGSQLDSRSGRQKDQLDRLKGPGHLDSDGVGIEPERMPLAVAADGGDHRNDVGGQAAPADARCRHARRDR